MSRAYKCERCCGLFEGEPSWDSIPIKVGGNILACIDFVTADICPKCRQEMLLTAAALIQAGEIEVKDAG
jgi:hypothetical protein